MISKITYSKVISTAFLFFSMLLNFTIVFAQSRTASYEFIDADTKGYASIKVPDWLSNNPNDEEVMAVGSKLDPANPNATTTALHLVRYNNLGQLIVNKFIDDIYANERAVSICLYDPKTFVILSSYSIPGSSTNYKAKLTFVDISGQILSEELLKIVPPFLPITGSYDNVFPMHAIMHQGELYICGALQSGSGSSGVGLDFTLPKAGFVYNYNTQQTGVIEPNSPTPGNQFYTLAKRLREVDTDLFVLGMYDHDFPNSSGNPVNGPTPFYAKVNQPLVNSSSFGGFKILSTLKGCASDIIENSSNPGEYIVLSQGMTNQNTSSNPSALVTTTGVYLSYIPNPTTFYTVNLTQVDNQTATSMYKDPFNINKIIIAGWEQRISSPLYPILGGNTNTVLFPYGPRDNAFLYDVDYTYDPLNPTNPFAVTVNNYSVFANLINNTQSYRNLGGPNMSNFYLLPDNAIQRLPANANGYIISTLFKNKQPSSFYHGLKTIYTNNITSCDAVLNPYYSTPYVLNSYLDYLPTLSLPSSSIIIKNTLVNLSVLDSTHSIVELCENNGKYRLTHNEYLNNEIRIYPNPAYSNAVINVKLNDEWIANSTFQLELKNIEGQVLSTSDIRNSNSEFTYTLPSIPPGMYFLTLTNASGSKKHFTISVQ